MEIYKGYKGRCIVKGKVTGIAIKSLSSISFLGDVDVKTGKITDKTNTLYSQSIANKIFVFPTGSGSTVGSYIIYGLKMHNVAPLGIINELTDSVVAIGAILAEIPTVDKIDISKINTGCKVTINGDRIYLESNKEA